MRKFLLIILGLTFATSLYADWGEFKRALEKLEYDIIPQVTEERDLGASSLRFEKLWIKDIDVSGSITGFSSTWVGTATSDLEMGNTPYSIDGGTSGLAFDPDNDNANEVTFDTAGEVNCVGIDTSAPIVLANDETITNAVDGQIDFTDGTNVLMRIADDGLVGDVTVTGDLQVNGGTTLVLTDYIYGDFNMGKSGIDNSGVFTMWEGAELSNAKVELDLNTSGNFSITTDTGRVILDAQDDIYLNATGGEVITDADIYSEANNQLIVGVQNQGATANNGVGLIIRADDGGTGGDTNGGPIYLDIGSGNGTGYNGWIELDEDGTPFGYITNFGVGTGVVIAGECADGNDATVLGSGLDLTSGNIVKFVDNLDAGLPSTKASLDYLGTWDCYSLELHCDAIDEIISLVPSAAWTKGGGFIFAFDNATTLTGDLVGTECDFATNLTATNQNVYMYTGGLPAVTNTGAGSYDLIGLAIGSSAIDNQNAGGSTEWYGANINLPDMTQTAGTCASYGISLQGGTITSGTQQLIKGQIIQTVAGIPSVVINTGLGDDIADVGGIESSILGYSHGMTSDNYSACYSAVINGDDDDTSHTYVGYAVVEAQKNGGTSDMVAFANIGSDIDYLISSYAGDVEFNDYSVNIFTRADADGNGPNMTIYAGDGRDAGATARNGGILSLYGGANVNAGSDGYVKIGKAAGTITQTLTDDDLFLVGKLESNNHIFLDELGTATVGTTDYYSPSLYFRSSVWDSDDAIARTPIWELQGTTVSGATPYGTLNFWYADGIVGRTSLMNINRFGNFYVNANISGGSMLCRTGDFNMGSATYDGGDIIINKGAQAGDPYTKLEQSDDANGNATLSTSLGDITLDPADDLYITPASTDGQITISDTSARTAVLINMQAGSDGTPVNTNTPTGIYISSYSTAATTNIDSQITSKGLAAGEAISGCSTTIKSDATDAAGSFMGGYSVSYTDNAGSELAAGFVVTPDSAQLDATLVALEQNVNIKPLNISTANGFNTYIQGADALTGGGGNGGILSLSGGAADGAGTSGYVLVNGNAQLGSATADCGTFTMIKGAQTSDPQVQFALSSDANGDFSITADTGHITLNTGSDDDVIIPLADLQMGTLTQNADQFRMIDGDETGDDTFTIELSHDGAGDVAFATSDGDLDLNPGYDIDMTIPATGQVYIQCESPKRTSTRSLVQVDSILDSSISGTVDVIKSIVSSETNMGVNNFFSDVTVGDLANSYVASGFKSDADLSNCTTATSTFASFLANDLTPDAQCTSIAFYNLETAYDYAFYSEGGNNHFEMASDEEFIIDGYTTNRSGSTDLCTIKANVNSTNSDTLFLDTQVTTILSDTEVVNGLNVYLDSNSGSHSGSFGNGIYLNSNTATGGIVTAIKGEGTWDNYIDFANFDVAADGDITIVGEIIYTPSSDQSRANDSTITIANGITRVVGSGGAVVLDTAPAIEDGVADGQIVIIQGTHDTNTVTIADNCNCQLAGGVSFVLGKGDTIQLIWDSGDSDWYEVSRSDN